MTDAQIALYAAVRAAIPTSWRVRLITPRRIAPGGTVLVDCTRERNHELQRLAHAVPADILEDPRYTEGTIGIDVSQIVSDLGFWGAAGPQPLDGLFLAARPG
jgi:hypothetical protein